MTGEQAIGSSGRAPMTPEAAATTAGLDAAVERLRLIRSARAAGVTWAQIGARLGMDAKAAKRGAKLLERDTRRQFLLAAQAGGEGPGGAAAREVPPPSPRFRTVPDLAARHRAG